MAISVIFDESATAPEVWIERLRGEPAGNSAKLRLHAPGLFEIDYVGWLSLVGIAEQTMRERGISF